MSTEYSTDEERGKIRLARSKMQRVRVVSGTQKGRFGTVYDYLPSRQWPWHARLDGISGTEPGIAFAEEELEFLEDCPLAAAPPLRY